MSDSGITQIASEVSLNGDLSAPVRIVLDRLIWQSSPSPGVQRKRLHRVGGAENGQVTSLVRYLPGARFSMHPHPEGEEILVLEGVFSDHTGDWPTGSYLLNPEGFSHAPFSERGCLLFVKLRQYPGDRPQVRVSSDGEFWEPGPLPEIQQKPLYQQERFTEQTRIERWYPGTTMARREYSGGVEILVVQGSLEDETGSYPALSWLRLPVGGGHSPCSPEGCELFIKEGGFGCLRSG